MIDGVVWNSRVNTSRLSDFVEGETELDNDRAMLDLGALENLRYDDDPDLEGDDNQIQINYIVQLMQPSNVTAGA